MKLFVGKNVLNAMVPTLINKDVFEPNDLKFTIWNRNYFCTNLYILETIYCKSTTFQF